MTADATTATTAADALARAAAGELLGPHDLMAIFRLKQARFYELKVGGAFDRFLVQRPIVGRACYSGTLVYRYVNGEAIEQPAFGAKRRAR